LHFRGDSGHVTLSLYWSHYQQNCWCFISAWPFSSTKISEGNVQNEILCKENVFPEQYTQHQSVTIEETAL